MFDKLPPSSDEFRHWSWSQIKPYYDDLASRDLTADSVEQWLADWTRLSDLVSETRWSLWVDTSLDTTDEEAARRFEAYLEQVFPHTQTAEQTLRQKFLDSGLEPAGFGIALRNMRADAGLFSADNLPLIAEQQKLSNEYEKLCGGQTVEWDGEEVTLIQLHKVQLDPDRDRRERAWRLGIERQLADREAINDLWAKLMDVRGKMAVNAGLTDFRAYRWQEMKRFDYTPEDCTTFHAAIEEVAVPAARRIYERRRRQLGIEALRPWDVYVDALGRPPLHPFKTADELESKTAAIFQRVDPQLGEYFEIMRREKLLDLENRKGKAPGAYNQPFDAKKLPFIFQNAIGISEDVSTLLHEGGHAFHVFESAHQPYHQQRAEGSLPMEVAEVASMAMELLAAPYLLASEGGFYSEADYARARVEHLEEIVRFWPYMAVVDAFQHWAYTHHDQASVAANCDDKWTELWDRFMVGIDYGGLQETKITGWHRKLHIFTDPFYYVDYGLAQMGALQVWRNARDDQAEAVRLYRHALSLGATVAIPEFYAAAGARFAFDADTLRELVDLIETTLAELGAA